MLSIRKGLALAMASAMLVVGCGGAAKDAPPAATPTTPAAPAAPAEPVKIEFWHGMADDSAHGKVLKALVDEFNSSQKGVQVTPVYQGAYADLEKKLTAAIAANTPPAVVQNTDSMLTNLVRSKSVQPLDQLIDKTELSDYIPALLKATTWDNQLMALPFNKSAIVLIYNKDLVKTPPKTWEEFAKVSKEVSVKDKRWGTAFEANVYDFGTHFAQAGGQWLTADGKPNFNTQAGIDAMNFMTDMIKEGSAIQLKPKEYKSNYFNEGRAVMIGSSTASYAYIKPADGSAWGVAPLYVGKNAAVPLSGANVSIISGIKDDQAKAAATFITWLTDTEATLQWGLGETGYGPVRLSAIKDARWTDFAAKKPEYGILADALSNGLIQVNHPQWQNVQKEVTSAVEKAFLGEDVKKALDEAATKSAPLLEKK
jgi:ABC-type glycerol-3-phosphate transport system substrate-binding protein